MRMSRMIIDFKKERCFNEKTNHMKKRSKMFLKEPKRN